MQRQELFNDPTKRDCQRWARHSLIYCQWPVCMSIDCVQPKLLAEAERLLSRNPFDLCIHRYCVYLMAMGYSLGSKKSRKKYTPDLPLLSYRLYGPIWDLVSPLWKSGAFDFVFQAVENCRFYVKLGKQIKTVPIDPINRTTAPGIVTGWTSWWRWQLRGKVLPKLGRSQHRFMLCGRIRYGLRKLVADLIPFDLGGARWKSVYVPVELGAILNELVGKWILWPPKKGGFYGALLINRIISSDAMAAHYFLIEVADLPLMIAKSNC